MDCLEPNCNGELTECGKCHDQTRCVRCQECLSCRFAAQDAEMRHLEQHRRVRTKQIKCVTCHNVMRVGVLGDFCSICGGVLKEVEN